MNKKDTSITIRISEAEKNKIKQIADQRDIPVSQVIRELVREIFQEEEK